MHVLSYVIVLVAGGALGYLFGGKVEADAKADIHTITTDAKAEVKKL